MGRLFRARLRCCLKALPVKAVTRTISWSLIIKLVNIKESSRVGLLLRINKKKVVSIANDCSLANFLTFVSRGDSRLHEGKYKLKDIPNHIWMNKFTRCTVSWGFSGDAPRLDGMNLNWMYMYNSRRSENSHFTFQECAESSHIMTKWETRQCELMLKLPLLPVEYTCLIWRFRSPGLRRQWRNRVTKEQIVAAHMAE